MKRRRAGESDDGLALMTSSVTSSYSADGLKEQSQESAVSHTVAAVVHLRSLGILTAAGCGIGSIHAVVRSNLLVEPSEVEEGEIVQVLGTKKTISSSYICPADGSQYKQSAVGLVFMESAAGLAMETSRVKSVVLGYQQMKRSKRDEATSCWRISRWFSVDDIIGDIIIFSRWFERAVARISSSRKLQWIQSQRKDFQTQCLYTQTQATTASSRWEIQSRVYMNQLLLLIQSQALRIQSQAEASRRKIPVAVFEASAVAQSIQAQRIVEVTKRSS
ncbi:hypothetical protein F511_21284 [Dorcoceras hygrometricum]|uniref:Uncharacterized protein n=1 Tax=Dorcoceras hygrometricum TaxID=472368 RepID=A0A2Z7CUV9_9LAMI|nr:hypothetical protein F511_21284 [Dorcoceras hygrometricum]